MRLAFFALLFVNLAYFAWAHWIDVPLPAPVNEAIAHLPRLKMADELPPAERPQPHAQKTALNATTACMSLGPFGDLANSTRAATLLSAKGFDPQQRAEQGESSEGYWVYVGGLATQAEADRALMTLERTGIKDALVMPETAEAGHRLSLGLYSERSRAVRRAEAVRQAGLKAEIAVRKLPSTLYWVDLTPPCPEAATTSPAPAPATGTAAVNAAAQEPATASNPPARATGLPKLP